jgi:membrane protein
MMPESETRNNPEKHQRGRKLKDVLLRIARVPGATVERERSRLIRIPFFGFVNEVLEGMGNDGASEVVGAIAYYGILSLFPLLLGVISLLGFFLPSATVQDQIFRFVEANLPAAEDILRVNITGIIQVRGVLGIVSVVGLFWSASAMFGAINRGVNRAWGLNVRHPFHVRKLREVGQSLSACVFFYILITASSVLTSFNPGGGLISGIGASLLAYLLEFFVFLLIYKTVPATKTHWRYVWPGALFAATAFELARGVMVIYFSRYSHVELVYGTIGSIIILLIFAYYVAFILIIGAELSSEYSRLRLGLAPRPRSPPDLCRR